jgi:uncharacterized membrane protein
MPLPRRSSQRLLALDAARGFAMLGVCISHFGAAIGPQERPLALKLGLIGMIASPTFILLSGAVLGYLTAVRRDDPGTLRTKLIDRGLFLLIVAHLLIDGAVMGRVHGAGNLTHALFMTDTIGFALIVGILVVPVTSPRRRLMAAGLMYLAAWVIVLFWHPVTEAARVFKEIGVGTTDQYSQIHSFPLVEWFAVFLAASVLGEAIAEARARGSLIPIGRWLLWTGPKWIAGAVAVKGLYLLARPMVWSSYEAMPPIWRDLYDLTTPFDKYPPGPTYFLAYGGLALILIGTIVVASERGWMPRVLEWAAVAGRASLFLFVMQFYLYYLLIPRLPMTSRWLLPSYFLASIVVLWLSARGWGRINGNRFFTVGLRAFAERQRTPAIESSTA